MLVPKHRPHLYFCSIRLKNGQIIVKMGNVPGMAVEHKQMYFVSNGHQVLAPDRLLLLIFLLRVVLELYRQQLRIYHLLSFSICSTLKIA